MLALAAMGARPLILTDPLKAWLALGSLSAALALYCRSHSDLRSTDTSGLLFPWPFSPTGDNLLWLCESATIIALLNVVPFALRDSDHLGHVPAPSDPEDPKDELEDEDDSDDDDDMFASLSIARQTLASENVVEHIQGFRGRRVSASI
jgi:hypothetical protein